MDTFIYLDTCALQRPLDDRSQLRIRLEADIILAVIDAIEEKKLLLVTSDVLRFETENTPALSRRDFARRVLSHATLKVASTSEVAQLAHQYAERGLQALDAVHLASAVVSQATYFCTVDDRLLTKARQANTRSTRVVSPHELMMEVVL